MRSVPLSWKRTEIRAGELLREMAESKERRQRAPVAIRKTYGGRALPPPTRPSSPTRPRREQDAVVPGRSALLTHPVRLAGGPVRLHNANGKARTERPSGGTRK
jgi:hypothetical protein